MTQRAPVTLGRRGLGHLRGLGRMLVYRNQFHITATYATYLAGVIGAAVGPV